MPKIMLIEDDKTMLDLLKMLLEIEGYEVAAYAGDEPILPVIHREQPNVILLDVNLKHFNGQLESGFDLLAAIRADDSLKHTGVIISSGIDYTQESKAVGADGFIMKPYMPEMLLNLIKETLPS